MADNFSVILDNACKSRERIPEVTQAVSELRERADLLNAEIANPDLAEIAKH